MRELFRPAVLMAVILAVPIVPFLFFGEVLEAETLRWLHDPPSTWGAAAMVVGLLAGDIFLPTPSSLISTLAAGPLGLVGGAAASFTGMSLGAIVGFALARRWGRPWARAWSGPAALARMERMSDRFGPAVLIIARGVPVLAEASVLLMGVNGLAWRRFLPPVLAANLALSVVYAAFGQFALAHGWLPLAVGVAVALPVLLATMLKVLVPDLTHAADETPPSKRQ